MENISFIDPETIKVKLTKNKYALADSKYIEKLKKYSWVYNGWGYASANIMCRVTTMHQYLFGKKDGLVIDHINTDPLDNRSKNIRFVNRSVNGINTRKSRGYYYDKNKKAFIARIQFNGINHWLGSSKDENLAELLYEFHRNAILEETKPCNS